MLDLKLGVGLVFRLGLAGCVVEDDGEAATAASSTGSTMPSTGESTPSTGAASSGSTGALDFDAYCEAFADRDACAAATEATCIWSDVTRYDPNTCEVLADVSSCFWTPVDSTDPGCAVAPGCDAQVDYQQVDGAIELSEYCGGPRPSGFEPCTYVSEGVFEPASCGCACTGGGGTSSGGDTEGSSTGSSSTGG